MRRKFNLMDKLDGLLRINDIPKPITAFNFTILASHTFKHHNKELKKSQVNFINACMGHMNLILI